MDMQHIERKGAVIKSIKCWVFANTFSQLFAAFCLCLLYGFQLQAGFLKAATFAVGGILYLVNYITVPINIVLLVILFIKSVRNRQLSAKRVVFIAINILVSIGYIVLYVVFLSRVMRSVLA